MPKIAARNAERKSLSPGREQTAAPLRSASWAARPRVARSRRTASVEGAEVGPEEVHTLRCDPRPVDRVNRPQRMLSSKIVLLKQGFDDRLRIVEAPLDGQGVRVLALAGDHLPFLHRRDAPTRVQNEDADPLSPLQGLHRRRAGIARGCSQHHHRARRLAEKMREKRAQPLQGDVFERTGRPVEKLEHAPMLGQRNELDHLGPLEVAVGPLDERSESLRRKLACSQLRQHRLAERTIIQPAP